MGVLKSWNRLSSLWSENLERSLMKLGSFCGRRPYLTIAASIIVSLGLAACFQLTEFDDDIERSWSDPDSRVHDESDYFQSRYLEVGDGGIIFEARDASVDLLADEPFEAWYALLVALQEDFSYRYRGEERSFGDVCFRVQGECAVDSLLAYWNNDLDDFRTANLSTRYRFIQDNPREAVVRGQLFEDVTLDAEGNFERIGVVSVYFKYEGSDETDVMDLELVDFFEDWNRDNTDYYRIYFFVQNIDSEINRTIQVAVGPLIIGIGLMVGFLTFKMWHKDPVRSQTMLGVCGVIEVVLSLAAGLGLSAVVGVPFSGITPIVAFVVIGVAVDDVFILWDASTVVDPSLPVPIQMSDTLRRGGSSITMTSLTSFCGFMLGSTTRVQAVSWFCLNAGIIIMVDYLLQITFFVACMALDARRRQSNHYDCLMFCGPKGRDSDQERQPPHPVVNNLVGAAQGQPGSSLRRVNSVTANYTAERDNLRIFVNRYYAPLLAQKWFKILVVVVASSLFVFCAVGAADVSLGQRDADVLPNDSWALDYINARRVYYTARESTVFVVYRDGIDYTDPEVLAQSLSLGEAMVEIDEVLEFAFWLPLYNHFRAELELREPLADNFYHYLCLPLDDELSFFGDRNYQPFRDTVLLDNAADPLECSVRSSLMLLTIAEPREGARQARLYDKLTGVADASELDVFAYFDEFPFWDLYGLLLVETVWTLISGVAGVFFVLALFMTPFAAVVVVATLVVIDIEILGLMAWFDVSLNAVTFTALISSVSFGVDFCAHVAHGFLTYQGAPDLRAVHAVREIGVSVLNGAFSTFLGIVMMAAVPARAFKIFFFMFNVVIAAGLFHGLMVIPVVLSIINPTFVGTEKTGIAGSLADIPMEMLSSKSMPPVSDLVPTTEATASTTVGNDRQEPEASGVGAGF